MTDDGRAPLAGLNTRQLALSGVPRELMFGSRLEVEDTATALALINQRYALAPLLPEEVELRRMALAHDAVDRTGERFGRPFLARLAATLPGKPVLAHHDRASWPLGRFYAAELVPDAGTGVTWLVARWYLLKSAQSEPLSRQLDAGVISHVSIGFRGGELICEVCSEPFWGDCPHWPGQELIRDGARIACSFVWTDPRGTAEAVEGSLVWLGAQQGAQVIKEMEAPMERTEPAELEQCLSEALARVTAAEARAASLSAEQSRSESALSALRPLAADGQLYRDDLAAEIRRLAGILDAAQEAEVLCQALKDAGAERLKAARDEYQRRVDRHYPPSGVGRPADATPARATVHPRAHSLI
jgi:hypothetical protein